MIQIFKNDTWQNIKNISVFKNKQWNHVKAIFEYRDNEWQRFFTYHYVLEINEPRMNFNLNQELQALNFDGEAAYVTIIVNAPIGSANTDIYAFDTLDTPNNIDLILINNSSIIGAGGKGGDIDNTKRDEPGIPLSRGMPGGNGGSAIRLTVPTEIININGYIFGGGGGGGASSYDEVSGGNAGGGGAGSIPGLGGSTVENSLATLGRGFCARGNAGTDTAGGASGDFDYGDWLRKKPHEINHTYTTGRGGRGGDLGMPGETTNNRFDLAGVPNFYAPGGKAGIAITGKNFIKKIIGETIDRIKGGIE